ncbi:MAG: cell division FtsA domain-containing protein [Negativicutes bacterium]|nr:cell division FtsA domain-containing protein [Negativicutes bacterium]
MEKQLLFALDIGTRSVVGLVGEQTANGIKVLALERQEHTTRAMLDGQIHDVPEVALVLGRVTASLTEIVGPLKKVSVAAAGRALCTVRAEAEIDCTGRGILSADDERALELAAIQAAQHQLATGNAVEDPASYYCVGYSVVRFALDGNTIKTLVGQRGKASSIELIATFLPRQVIDSLQAAVQQVGLEIATLTLEPIAAISVLIPPTMRHLNLALVDVGAGTSDVAITKNGSVIGYGMVPCAGDEITEALSQEYLLDFKVAEPLKRQLGTKNKKVTFTDILGVTHKLEAEKIVEQIVPAVTQLAEAIATQITALNATTPQAVLLVGGGSLTPCLPEQLAAALGIAPSRVAIRRPDTVDGIAAVPPALCAPDGVTPLGILKLAGSRTLNFIHVTLNGQPLRLFNLGKLSVADALLVAGIEVRSLHGRPGLGITVTINGKKEFIPGSLGQSGNIKVNGAHASFSDLLKEGDILTVEKGCDGEAPSPVLKDIAAIPGPYTLMINDDLVTLGPLITINASPADATTKLSDRDQIVCRPPATLAEVLSLAGMATEAEEHRYIINGIERSYRRRSEYTVNGAKAELTTPLRDNDMISIPPLALPTLAELLGLDEQAVECYTVLFNDSKCRVPIRRYTFSLSGKPAKPTDPAQPGSSIEYACYEVLPMVSDVLLAAEFDPRSLPAASRIDILLNGQPAEYTTPVKNGDKMEIKILARRDLK